jgi:hypothetical protein
VRRRSQILRKRLEGLGFPGGAHHLGADAGEGPGDGGADAARRSGDDPILEREGRSHGPMILRRSERTPWL